MDISNLLAPIFEYLSASGDFIFMLWVLWGIFVFWNLLHYGRGRQRFLSGMNAGLTNTYRRKLESILDWTATHWFKDKNQLEYSRLTDKEDISLGVRLFGVDAFTVLSYEFMFRLAVLYPILIIFIVWGVSGKGGVIGELQVLAPQDSSGIRLFAIATFLCSTFSFYRSLTSNGVKRWLMFLIALFFDFSFTFSGALGGSVAVAFAIAVAFSGSLAVCFTFAFSGAFSGGFAVTVNGPVVIILNIAVAIAFAVAVAVVINVSATGAIVIAIAAITVVGSAGIWEWLYAQISTRIMMRIYWPAYTIFYLLLNLAVLLWLSQQTNVTAEAYSLPIFLSLLPLLNAPLDWLSLGVTRSLLYAITDRVHSGFRAFSWAMVDCLVAFFFLVLITVIMVSSMAGINGIAAYFGGNQIINLRLIFDGMAIEPFHPNFWWIYFILGSTLIPTMLHMLIASWSIFLWLPQHWLDWSTKEWRAKQLQHDSFKFISAWAYWTLFSPLITLVPLLMLFMLWLLLHDWGQGVFLAGWLLEAMQLIAVALDPSY